MISSTTPRLLKAADAARCLGLTKSTVYDWIARGYLPCHRFGRTIRISVQDLEEYLAKSRLNTLATPRILEAQRQLGIDPERHGLDDPASGLAQPAAYAAPTTPQTSRGIVQESLS